MRISHADNPAPTLQEIALQLGVSKGTVSLALNDQPGVNAETRQRVKDYARQIGYRPNAIARALGTGYSRLIAVALARLNDSFFDEIVQGIENIARVHDYDILVRSLWSRGPATSDLADRLISRRIEGLIGSGELVPPEARRRLRDAGIPQLYISPEPVEDYPTVRVDNHAGATLAAAHLYEHGHRRILFLGTHDRHSALRSEAAEAYLAKRGDAAVEVRLIDGLHKMESAYYALATRLRTRRDFTAVFCASDILAIGACNALLDAGVAIPNEVSIVGYDDLPWARLVRPALTTVHQPHVTQGECAMRALMTFLGDRGQKQLASETLSPESLLLSPRLIARDSSGPAPQSAGKKV